MARTRNLDPGRVPALHYAFTRLRRHAKRQVYAFWLALVGLAAAGPLGPQPALGHPGPALPAARQTSAVRAARPDPPPPCAECVVLSVTPEQTTGLPPRLDGARIAVRVTPGAGGWQPALETLRARGGQTGVHVTGVPGEGDAILAAAAGLLILEPAAGDPEQLAFDLKRALAEARGRRPDAMLIVAAPPELAAALRERGIEPYTDVIVSSAAPLQSSDALADPHEGPLRVRTLPQTGGEAAAIAAAAVALQRWLPAGLVPLRDRALRCGGGAAIDTYLNPRTLDLIGLTSSCPLPATVTSDVPGAAIERLDLASRSVFLVHAGDSGRFAEGVDVSAARTLTVEEIVARHQAAAARQAAAIETLISEGTMALTFEAPGFVAPVTVTSETTVFRGAGSGEQAPITEIRQANIRVNGVAFDAGGGAPKLPIIEPERAAAPPLAITLSDLYAYRLAGRERLRGRDAYVIAFEPRKGKDPDLTPRDAASLYRGRAWIDAATFGLIRVAAAQTGLTGAITASEQADDFAPDAGGRWLLTRSDVRQTYEGASVRTPIHRLLVVHQHLVNAADFGARRAAALASDAVMLRDTPAGFRYLAKAESGKQPAEGGERTAESGQPPVRVLAGRATRVRTFAFGVIVDPNISRPLPFAGVSYVDFDWFGTGAQFSGFFGGSYGQLAFSAPSVRGTRWQLAGRAFGIATSYNDRAFENGREQYALDIRQRPAHAAVWLLRPLSPRTALRLEYAWDYNRYGRHDVTSPEFVVPRNQNAHTIRIGLDAQRAGWQGSIWGSHSRRIGWRAWGLPAERAAFSGDEASYQRYGASVLRAQAWSRRVTSRVEAAVMGGSGLDRFSRYAFGTFDNRLRGYPSALIRYDRGGVIRTAAAIALFRVMRLDGFADSAFVHDPGFGRGLRQYTGLGAALEAPAPFGTLISVEWGYGVQGIDAEGRRGTHVLRLSGYKLF